MTDSEGFTPTQELYMMIRNKVSIHLWSQRLKDILGPKAIGVNPPVESVGVVELLKADLCTLYDEYEKKQMLLMDVKIIGFLKGCKVNSPEYFFFKSKALENYIFSKEELKNNYEFAERFINKITSKILSITGEPMDCYTKETLKKFKTLKYKMSRKYKRYLSFPGAEQFVLNN